MARTEVPLKSTTDKGGAVTKCERIYQIRFSCECCVEQPCKCGGSSGPGPVGQPVQAPALMQWNAARCLSAAVHNFPSKYS